MIVSFEEAWKKRAQRVVNSWLDGGLLIKWADGWYLVWTRKEKHLGMTIGEAKDTLMEMVNQKYLEEK